MVVEFRPRDYAAERRAHTLPRVPADDHPLSTFPLKGDVMVEENNDTLDPLRALCGSTSVPFQDSEDVSTSSKSDISGSDSAELLAKEWRTFKRLLVQRFPASKVVSFSSIADLVTGSRKAYQKSLTMHLDELDDPQGSADEDVKYITQQEYVARLSDMKNEIECAWRADDHFNSLKLSVKVARLLRDTALLQFYPTLFTLATDILDMFGDMVWERIKRKAEFSEDGVEIHSLSEGFQASDVCPDAKETCHNWFCKIGSIRELLPRIYLELAILPCWRFLSDNFADVVQRLVSMMRGLGDPLASAYCHLYFAYCAQKLPPLDEGYLMSCIRDISLIVPIVSTEETADRNTMSKQIVVRLLEPSVEYIVKCMFKKHHQKQAAKIVVELGLGRNKPKVMEKSSCLSLVLHHLLKELPPEVIISSAVDILDLIKRTTDSSFDQSMNFRLLGFRLYEKDCPMDVLSVVLERVIQVVNQYKDLDAFVKVVDGYIDIVLQNQMKSQLKMLLEGIVERACRKWAVDSELESLQSVLIKILTHRKCLDDVLELNHFVEIMDFLRGSSRNTIYMRILEMATRNGSISNPAAIQLLFEVCQGLCNCIDGSNMVNSDSQTLRRLHARFVQMVDFGTEWERHLAFLVECRLTFACEDELKESLVHHGNGLAMKALTDPKRHFSFIRACLAFCEATIPSISTPVKKLSLYLETAEVAVTSGSVGHSDGLINSALDTLQSINIIDDSEVQFDVERTIGLTQKLCGLLLMVPGNPTQGAIYMPKCLLSIVKTQSWWITARLRVKTMTAIISLLAALSQNNLPYHASGTVGLGNDLLFYDDPSYQEELVSLCDYILRNIVPVIKQEASPIARGSLALEACNCIASFLKMDDDILSVCNELTEIAKSCSSIKHNNYLLSTSNFLAKHLRTGETALPPLTSR